MIVLYIQRLYSVVDVFVETHCMRLYFVNPFYTRSKFLVSRRMQCVSTNRLNKTK